MCIRDRPVAVHQRTRGPVGVGGDPGDVPARERRALEGALGLLVDAVGGGADAAAVAGGGEAVLRAAARHREADGTAARAVHVVRVAAADVGEGAGLLGGAGDGDEGGVGLRRLEERRAGRGGGGVHDDPVGRDVDVPDGHVGGRLLQRGLVEALLHAFEPVQAVANDLGACSRAGDAGGLGGVGGGDGQGRLLTADPGSGEAGAEGLLQPGGEGRGPLLLGYPAACFVRVETEVPLHGGQQPG